MVSADSAALRRQACPPGATQPLTDLRGACFLSGCHGLSGLSDLHGALFPALSDAYPAHFPRKVYTQAALCWAAAVLGMFSVQLAPALVAEPPPRSDLRQAPLPQSSDATRTVVVPHLAVAAARHSAEATCCHDHEHARRGGGGGGDGGEDGSYRLRVTVFTIRTLNFD
jgi:hypothetical protein